MYTQCYLIVQQSYEIDVIMSVSQIQEMKLSEVK